MSRDALLILNYPFDNIDCDLSPYDVDVIISDVSTILADLDSISGAEAYPENGAVIVGFYTDSAAQLAMFKLNAAPRASMTAYVMPYRAILNRPISHRSTIVLDDPNLLWARINLPRLTGFKVATLVHMKTPNIIKQQCATIPPGREELHAEFGDAGQAAAALEAIRACTLQRPRLM
eukprot:GILI01020905.1.p1 GENE.GILI01020905.1~~GILI01020905.1.p1  ORF type:complete len:177 (-),score=5.89 GILI01020905.1:57-587(-)